MPANDLHALVPCVHRVAPSWTRRGTRRVQRDLVQDRLQLTCFHLVRQQAYTHVFLFRLRLLGSLDLASKTQ